MKDAFLEYLLFSGANQFTEQNSELKMLVLFFENFV